MNAPVKRFRDMRLTGPELDGLLEAMFDRYDYADVGTQCAGQRAVARAKRLLPLWRDIGLRDLGRLQSALSRKLESENVALTKRVAEQAALIECAAAEFREALTYTRDLQSQLTNFQQRVVELEAWKAAYLEWQDTAAKLIERLQSQLAWTPVSKGLPTEPGWYVFHGAEREPELLYGADTGQYSFWVGGSKTYDMEEMSHFSDYRRIELPKDGES